MQLTHINFKGRRVLITGHTRGIGKAIYDLFGRYGAKLMGVSTNQADFRDTSKIDQYVSEICGEMPYDVLINNAGMNKIDNFPDVHMPDFYNILQVNFLGAAAFTKLLIEGMKQQNYGRIVNIGSVYSSVTREGRIAYTTSKHALAGFTKTIALEYAPYNVLVNCVSPGFTDTELTRNVLGQEGIDEVVKNIPMGRMCEPAEIAKLVAFLCSDQNTYVTGQNIMIDGGYTLR